MKYFLILLCLLFSSPVSSLLLKGRFTGMDGDPVPLRKTGGILTPCFLTIPVPRIAEEENISFSTNISSLPGRRCRDVVHRVSFPIIADRA
jgi:hypothetical protein